MGIGFRASAAVVLCASLALGGCVANSSRNASVVDGGASGQATQPAQDLPAFHSVPVGTEVAPIAFDRVLFALEQGQAVGSPAFLGLDCRSLLGVGDITWGGGLVSARDFDFQKDFYEELTAMGYDIAGNPEALFATANDSDRAEYLVAARVTDIDMELCYHDNIWAGGLTGKYRGTGWMNLEWQVFDLLAREVVYRTTTRSYAELKETLQDGHLTLIYRAFGAAVEHLGSDPGFLETVKRKPHDMAVASLVVSPDAALRQETVIPNRRAFRDPFTTNASTVRNATAVILSGRGHGSGFFISDDGYLLTNQHVVGGVPRVRVRLEDGREVIGEVLKRDRERDVALVKVELEGLSSLPLRRGAAKPGEEVFAIGAPKDESLSATVSKGIVSALRRDGRQGLPYIQADVSIHGGNSGGPLTDASGNVVGIAVAGLYMGEGKTSSGLNLFIPIDDALERLSISVR